MMTSSTNNQMRRWRPSTSPAAAFVALCYCLTFSCVRRPAVAFAFAFATHGHTCTNIGSNRWPLLNNRGQQNRPSATVLPSSKTTASDRATDIDGSSTNGAATGTTNDATADESPHLKTADILSLPSIRSTLIRQEETIIFALIERSQFRQNAVVYERGSVLSRGLGVPLGSSAPDGGTGDDDDDDDDDEGDTLSFLEYMLLGTEILHSSVRRYTSPEEHPFFPSRLPSSMLLQELDYPDDLLSSTGGAGEVNFNQILLKKYIDVVVKSVADSGDDEQYGSTVLADIAVLQALSRRVHYGKFVAESKYRSDPVEYQRLVDEGDSEGVMQLLTNSKVEDMVLRRARLKAATYGREPLLSSLPYQLDGSGGESEDETTAIIAAAAASAVVAAVEAMKAADSDDEGSRGKVDPTVIESVYRDIIIPLTKDIEVAYLFRRCGKEPPEEFAPDRMSTDCL